MKPFRPGRVRLVEVVSAREAAYSEGRLDVPEQIPVFRGERGVSPC